MTLGSALAYAFAGSAHAWSDSAPVAGSPLPQTIALGGSVFSLSLSSETFLILGVVWDSDIDHKSAAGISTHEDVQASWVSSQVRAIWTLAKSSSKGTQ